MSIRTSIVSLESRLDAHQEAIEAIEAIDKAVSRLVWISDAILAIFLIVVVPAVVWLAVEWVKLRGEM